ncbi:MAG: heavy-metal-associated domain-containing protein [Anaerolineales bacterium]|nr:heavy-metal-associated domain-containing protein [Anaerolineales bacterium]MCA9930684.1 heavy-metal-associated domain-containing protein [Anaerolineales bacterium]
MSSKTVALPMMYGDHHVLAVRQLLLALPGVKDVYASSSFQLVEITYDETQLSEDEIQSTLADAGYLEELPVPVEIGSSPAHANGKPFFRHTTAFAQTGQEIGFAQNVPDVQRPLWPCPGIKK